MSYSELSLEGRVAVIIGGTSGIGKAIALGMARAGADVVATSRREAEVRATADALRSNGRKTLELTSDVTSRDSLEKLCQQTLEKLGRVDILVNSAGRTKRTPTLEATDADFTAILDTNLLGTLRTCQIFGKHMLSSGYGRIVNIASLTSFVSFFEVAAYGASKAAVMSLTQALAIEWGPRGVNVNAIAPGVFRTPLNQALLDGTPRGQELLMRTPLKRFGRLEELVGAAIFLGSEAASFVNGQTLAVDGGFLASGVNQ
jgi:NAD(P)-dependent dehydrogenase (short-subunit alcohol dehydrogenase family)